MWRSLEDRYAAAQHRWMTLVIVRGPFEKSSFRQLEDFVVVP
jgi:hypothetical protein